MYVQFVYIESQHRICHVVRLPHQVEEHLVAPLPPLPLPSHQPAEPAEPVAVKTLKPAEMCQLPSVNTMDQGTSLFSTCFFWAF